MDFVRFVLPFLFVRNWYNGAWELSRARCIIFGAILLFIILGVGIVFMLQAPVTYTASV